MIPFAVVGAMAFAVDTVDFHPQVDGPAFHPGHGQNHRRTAGHDRLLRVEPAISFRRRGGRAAHHEAVLFT